MLHNSVTKMRIPIRSQITDGQTFPRSAGADRYGAGVKLIPLLIWRVCPSNGFRFPRLLGRVITKGSS
jgi:hypothetical protein